jgi:hypothetical protein
MLFLAAFVLFVIAFIVKLVGHSGTWDWVAFTTLGLACCALEWFLYTYLGHPWWKRGPPA